jgi:cation transport ATPase|tara:strand:- start:274 stop:666 length:393 start_codon:yes stop_codon:yes gene_type:complete
MVWQVLAKPLLGVVGDSVKNFAKHKAAKQELKVKEVEAEIKHKKDMAEGKIKWENQAQKNLENSYKDEIVLAILLLPCLFAFYPPAVEHIKTGFQVLEELPEWYMWLLFAGLSSAIGYRGVDKLMKFKNK